MPTDRDPALQQRRESEQAAPALGQAPRSASEARKPKYAPLPADVQARMDELCGRTEDAVWAMRQKREYQPPDCDLAPEILDIVRAAATSHGKAFQTEWLPELCDDYWFKRVRKLVSFHDGFTYAWKDMKESPAAYLRGCARRDEDAILRFITAKEKRPVEKAQILAECLRCLEMLRKTPDSESAIDLAAEVQRRNPTLWEEARAEYARKHAAEPTESPP